MNARTVTYDTPDVAQAQAAVNAARREWEAAHHAEQRAHRVVTDLGYGIATVAAAATVPVAQSSLTDFLAKDAEWQTARDTSAEKWAALQDARTARDAACEQRKADDIAALRHKLMGVTA